MGLWIKVGSVEELLEEFHLEHIRSAPIIKSEAANGGVLGKRCS